MPTSMTHALGEEMVAFIIARVLEKRRPELHILERNVEKLEKITTPFPRMTTTRP